MKIYRNRYSFTRILTVLIVSFLALSVIDCNAGGKKKKNNKKNSKNSNYDRDRDKASRQKRTIGHTGTVKKLGIEPGSLKAKHDKAFSNGPQSFGVNSGIAEMIIESKKKKAEEASTNTVTDVFGDLK